MEEGSGIWNRPSRGLWSDAFRKLIRNRLAIVGLFIVSLLMIAAIFGPLIAPYAYTEQNLLEVAKLPSREHWLGTEATWNDSVRQRFEDRYLKPLDPATDAAVIGLQKFAETLDRVRRDLSDRSPSK